MLANRNCRIGVLLAVGFSLVSAASNAVASTGLPLDVQARRAGEDVRRSAEDAYFRSVPDGVRRNVDKAAREADKAAKAAGQFIKGVTGK
jgi:hypothetical protein